MMDMGSFCYRFKDAAHAQAMLDTIADDPEHVAVNWGPHFKQTGIDGNGDPIMVADPGHLVFVLSSDTLGVEGWEQWQYKPDPWPHTFGGREIEQLASEELADSPLEVIPSTVVVRPTPEQREATREARQARREANAAILAARAKRDIAKARLDAANAEIDGLPAKKAAANDRVRAGNASLATLRTDRDAQTEIIANGTNIEKRAAREERDRLNALIDETLATVELDRAYRDSVDDMLVALRADRDAQRAALDELDVVLIDERAARQAAIDALGG